MDAEDNDGTDYDKTFIEEPAILDKYKAAAEVCDSKYNNLTFISSLQTLCQKLMQTWSKQ